MASITPLCQSCGLPISHLWKHYKVLINKYSDSNNDGVKKKKSKKTIEYLARQELIDKGTPKGQKLDSERLCCLYFLMLHHDMSDQIQDRI